MKLHRVTGKPDWANKSKTRYNRWQDIAARTHSILTPGNIVTILGIILLLLGLGEMLRHNYWAAAALLAAGRLSDIIDGWLAEQTGTKSPLGEILDAASDKLVTLLTVLVFIITHITFLGLLITLLLPHILIAAIAFIAQKRHKKLHPSRIGKLSMAAAWSSLLGLVLIKALRSSPTSVFSFVIYGIGVISFALGCIAAYGYIQYMLANVQARNTA